MATRGTRRGVGQLGRVHRCDLSRASRRRSASSPTLSNVPVDDRSIAQLGTPDLQVSGFQLWVHGLAYPESSDPKDLGWLRTTAHVGASGASVWVSGVFLEASDIQRFRDQLAAAYRAHADDAILAGHEPHLELRITNWDRLGNCRALVDLTPAPPTQRHRVEFAVDQSLVPAIIHDCDGIARRLR